MYYIISKIKYAKKHNKIKKNKNKNKNINKNNNEVHIHLGNHRRRVYDKSFIKKEIVKVPEIKTFTPLHQMTNYIPIPQAHQMTSHPNIPNQQPLLQHNPLLNLLRDISGRNRTIQDVFNDRLQLREEAKKTTTRRNK